MSTFLSAVRSGVKLRFRSGCPVTFIAHVPDAKPHCQLVLLNPSTGNIVTRYADGKSSDEPVGHSDPGDILLDEVVRGGKFNKIIADPAYDTKPAGDCGGCAFLSDVAACDKYACTKGCGMPTDVIWIERT